MASVHPPAHRGEFSRTELAALLLSSANACGHGRSGGLWDQLGRGRGSRARRRHWVRGAGRGLGGEAWCLPWRRRTGLLRRRAGSGRAWSVRAIGRRPRINGRTTASGRRRAGPPSEAGSAGSAVASSDPAPAQTRARALRAGLDSREQPAGRLLALSEAEAG